MDERMRDEHLLDLTWIDVRSSTNDQLLRSTNDAYSAVRIHRGQISGIVPVVLDHLPGLVFVSVVAEEHERTSGHQFTLLADLHDLFGVLVHQLHFGEIQWHSDVVEVLHHLGAEDR